LGDSPVNVAVGKAMTVKTKTTKSKTTDKEAASMTSHATSLTTAFDLDEDLSHFWGLLVFCALKCGMV
jgi:hypothetical protein